MASTQPTQVIYNLSVAAAEILLAQRTTCCALPHTHTSRTNSAAQNDTRAGYRRYHRVNDYDHSTHTCIPEVNDWLHQYVAEYHIPSATTDASGFDEMQFLHMAPDHDERRCISLRN